MTTQKKILSSLNWSQTYNLLHTGCMLYHALSYRRLVEALRPHN